MDGAEQTLALTITARDMASAALGAAQERLSLMATAAAAADAALGRVGAVADAVKRTLASFVPGAQRAVDVLAAFRRFQAQSWSGAEPSYLRSFSLFSGILAPVVPLFGRFLGVSEDVARVPLERWASSSSEAIGGRLSRAALTLSAGWLAMSGVMSSAINWTKGAFNAIVEKSSELSAKVGSLGVSFNAILAPALVGLGVIVAPLVSELAEWAQGNQEILAQDLARWAIDTAGAAIDFLVPAVSFVAQGWYGIQIAAVAVRGAVETTFGAMLGGATKALMSVSRLAGAVGKDQLASRLAEAAAFTRGLGAEFDKAGATAPGQILAIEARIEGLRKLIAQAGDTAKKQLGPALAAALAAVKNAAADDGKGGGGDPDKEAEGMMDAALRMAAPFLAERRAEAAKLRQEEEAFERNMQEARDALANANQQEAERDKRAREEAIRRRAQLEAQAAAQRLESERRISQAVGGTLMSGVAAARSALMAGKNAGEVALSGLEALGNRILDNIIAKGILAIANALTGGLAGAGGGFLGAIFGFARGGYVPETAGIPGVDSVPALLMPGELVVPRDEARAIRSGAAGLTAGGGGGGGGGGITINVDARSTVPDSRADLERRIRPVAAAARQVERSTGAR